MTFDKLNILKFETLRIFIGSKFNILANVKMKQNIIIPG